LQIEYFSGLPLEQILERVGTLAPKTAILYTIFAADSKGTYRNPDVLQRISKAANAPIVGLYDTLLTYLALAPKSNRALTTYGAARKLVMEHGALPVPAKLRPSSNAAGRSLGHGEGYKYPHDFEGAYVPEDYLPEKLVAKPDLASTVNAVFQFDVTGAGVWTIDLATPGGVVKEGHAENAGCVITVGKDDWEKLLDNPGVAMQLFMTGKLKVTNVGLALQLQKILA
jgi:hypothetical protein